MGLFIGLLGQFFTSNHFVGEVFSADPGYGSGVTFGSFFFAVARGHSRERPPCSVMVLTPSQLETLLGGQTYLKLVEGGILGLFLKGLSFRAVLLAI